MPSATVTLDTRYITDWPSFHDQCAAVFGFPGFYGRNMNAWIDCLTYLPEGDGMSAFELGDEGKLYIEVLDYAGFAKRVPDVCIAFLESTAFVNQRYLEASDTPRLVLVLQ